MLREAERLAGANTPEARAQAHRERMAQRSRSIQSAVADIGALPAVIDPGRKESCRLELHRFLVTYFPQSTGLKPFSEDHLRAITRLQTCILEGGLFAQVFPRGYAKTLRSPSTSPSWGSAPDTNYWKTFVHARLAVSRGDPGCLSLFAADAMGGGSPATGRALDGGISGADQRPGPRGGRVEDQAAQAGQPLAGLPGGMCGGGERAGRHWETTLEELITKKRKRAA